MVRLRWPAVLLSLLLGLGSCSSHRLYWGDVHGHTEHSDGQGSVAEFLAQARDQAGLDFVIVTDHDFGNAAPWRMSPEVWRHTQETVEQFLDPGQFIPIAGYEWTSAPKYWSEYADGPSEEHFAGPPRYFNHKNVYFPAPVPDLFGAKQPDSHTPDLLAGAVRKAGGLVHNNHPGNGPEVRDQWAYSAASAEVIANTELYPDVIWHEGVRHETGMETEVRQFLNRGGRTGFVGGSDTHTGRPVARTAVFARELTRAAIFEALRNRRCYAVSQARIVLDFRINGHWMGEQLDINGKPQLSIEVHGSDRIAEVMVVRDGEPLRVFHPQDRRFRVRLVDESFDEESYYYVRVTQVDTDPHGNRSRAWSSPIWVRTLSTASSVGGAQ